MNNIQGNSNVRLISIYTIVLTILLYLLRTTVPFLKFPFLFLFLGLILYSIINFRISILLKLKEFRRTFYIPIILLIILIVAFFLSNKLYLSTFKDIFNAIILISLFFLMSLIITSKRDLNLFYDNLIRFIIVFSLLICVVLLGNFLNLFSLNNPLPSNKFLGNLSIDSLSSDYNFVLLPVFFGFIGALYFLSKPLSLLKKGILNLILIIYMMTIVVSGSRRGMITFTCIIIILLIVQLFVLITKDSKLKKINSNSSWFLLTIIVLVLFSYGFVFKTSYHFKKNVLELIGSKNINSTKAKLVSAIYRYASIINKDVTYLDIYDKIWFSPLDPDSGWGTSIHKTIFPLIGEAADILPHKARGYLLDSTCNADVIGVNAYSYTLIGNRKVKKGDILLASVYCFISKDFNGNLVQFFSEGSTFGNIVTEDEKSNLNRNHQDVNLTHQIKDTLSGSSQSFSAINEKRETSSDNTLIDNIIPDFKDDIPERTKNLVFNGNFKDGTLYWAANADSTIHEIIETPFGRGIRVSRTNGNGGWWSLAYIGPSIIYHAGHRYQLKFDFKIEKGSNLPFNIGWWVNESNRGYSPSNLPLTIKTIKDGWKEAICSYKFRETHYNLTSFLNSLQDFSVIDIANVEMQDLDGNVSIPSFVDQLGVINTEKRGIWRKITLKADCNEGNGPVFISFSKKRVPDFSSLKGYIIFACPEYKIITKKDSVTSSIQTTEKINTKYSLANDFEESDKLNLSVDFINQMNKLNTTNRIDSDFNNKCDSLIWADICKNSSISNQSSASLFPVSIPMLTFLIPTVLDRDPIRKLAAKLISEDTTYYGYKKDLVVDTISNKFIADRAARWEFATQIFLKEYDWKQKIFGGGFNFLNWFGFYFENDKSFTDYPHNPFLSILLYSGLIGLLIYLIYLFKVIHFYIRYLKEYPVLFLFFIITFFFSFFSAGSPFDPPIMGFFVLLPFFLNLVHKKQNIDKISE